MYGSEEVFITACFEILLYQGRDGSKQGRKEGRTEERSEKIRSDLRSLRIDCAVGIDPGRHHAKVQKWQHAVAIFGPEHPEILGKDYRVEVGIPEF